jgi:hypothetical protein
MLVVAWMQLKEMVQCIIYQSRDNEKTGKLAMANRRKLIEVSLPLKPSTRPPCMRNSSVSAISTIFTRGGRASRWRVPGSVLRFSGSCITALIVPYGFVERGYGNGFMPDRRSSDYGKEQR